MPAIGGEAPTQKHAAESTNGRRGEPSYGCADPLGAQAARALAEALEKHSHRPLQAPFENRATPVSAGHGDPLGHYAPPGARIPEGRNGSQPR